MTDDVEVYSVPVDLGRTNTDDWYEVFGHIVKLAEYVNDTSFVPDTIRRSPGAVAATILTGRELGIGPMAALRQIYLVHGRPGLSAELMRALIYRAGHEINFVEATDTRCVLEGRRKGEQDFTRVAFTAEDARKESIDIRRFAADKLVARATSRLARRKFADVIAGMPAIEELEDHSPAAEIVELAPTPPVQRKRAPRKAKAAATQPSQVPRGVAAALPDNDDDLLDEEPQPSRAPEPAPLDPPAPGTHVTDTFENPDFENQPALPLEPDPPATKNQHATLQTTLKNLQLPNKPDQLTIINRILGYNLGESRSLLTKTEASDVISTLNDWTVDEEYPVDDRIRDILNEAAIAEAEAEAKG